MSNNRILIADDNKEARMILKKILEDYNFIIDEACDGNEALELYKSKQYDLILLDVKMPHKNGDEICRIIKMDQKNYVPVILITAMTESSSDFSNIYESQADDIFQKPFNENVFMMRIKSYIRLKKYHEELYRQKSKVEQELTRYKNFSFEILKAIETGVLLFDKTGAIVFESESAKSIVGSALNLPVNDFFRSDLFVTGKGANFDFSDDNFNQSIYLTTRDGKYVEVKRLTLRKDIAHDYGVISIKEIQQDVKSQKANHNTLKSFLKSF